MKPKFEVGQSVWVSETNIFSESKPYITEHIVVKVTSVSVHVKPKNYYYSMVFNKNSLTSKKKNSKHIYVLWLTPEAFWDAAKTNYFEQLKARFRNAKPKH